MDDKMIAGIREAVACLDPNNDDDWTAAGLPDVAVIKQAMNDRSITRVDIETACPGVTRMNLGGDNGSEELPASAEAATEAAPQVSEAGADDAAAADQDAGEADAEVDQEGSAAADEVGSLTQAPVAGLPFDEYRTRVAAMAVVLRLPQAYRSISERDLVDDISAFMATLYGDSVDERYTAYALLEAIGETRPAEIPGGQYKDRIRNAMAIIRKEAITSEPGTGAFMAKQREAAARMVHASAGIPRASTSSAEDEARKAAMSDPRATDEQKAGLAGLYAATAKKSEPDD